MIYRVVVTQVAESAIDRYVEYIAVEKQAPEVAAGVLSRIRDSLATLETFPHAGPKAPEDEHRGYTIRFRRVDRCLILYHVKDETREVRVIGFRHGAQLPRPDELAE